MVPEDKLWPPKGLTKDDILKRTKTVSNAITAIATSLVQLGKELS